MGPPSQSGGTGRDRPWIGPAWLLRCILAVGAPVGLALALEGSLRLAGYGRPTGLFIDDETPGYVRTNPAFTVPFFPEQFDIYPLSFRIERHKAPGHVRIFVLGESAAKGTPEPAFGFAALLGAQLRAAYPDTPFEVFNLGIVAVNSHVVYQAAKQAAALEPDLFVVYMGNNEVVGPFGPGSVNASVMPPLWVIRASAWIGGTRSGQLLRRLAGALARIARGRPLEWHGMGTFAEKTVRGDDPRLEAVYANYESNLRGILAVAGRAGIKTVLATVVANLKDNPPFASLHRAGMSKSELEHWDFAYRRGVTSWEIDRPDEAIPALGEALGLDPQYAEAHFILGRLLEAKGDEGAARGQFLEALHWDALRFRPELRINAIARRAASEAHGAVLLADSAQEFGFDAQGAGPTPGREVLLEHVHFNWEGNVRMSRLLAGVCASALFATRPPEGRWLDSQGCADAVGFTKCGRLGMLRQMEPIRGKPPFTNQITFGEDQVRYRHELDDAERAATSPEGLAAARAQLEAALRRSPKDTNLALLISEVESQAGDNRGALAWLDRVLELEPRSPELLVRRARALDALHRAEEAQESILEAIRMDRFNLPSYPALVEVVRDTGDFELCRGVLLDALSRNPTSGYIRLSYADLLFLHGDRAQAETECRAVLAGEPDNPDPLGRLVSLYEAEGHKDKAFPLMEQARVTQPLNYENNLELAKVYEARGDEDRAVECLRDAARSGPATTEAHIFIARHLGRANRHMEELVELHRARRVALLSGDEDLAQRVSETIRAVAGDAAPVGADNRH
jgi:tetratricopeptide (TPR) repeat protein